MEKPWWVPIPYSTELEKNTKEIQMQGYFDFHFTIDDRYALFVTPNAYGGILMGIFRPYLFFQCVFNDFQCVITLLCALSVALLVNN